MTSLRTPICDFLGIEYPSVQSGMGSAAGPELAAEVSRAGGLGIIAGLGTPADELRRRIRHVRSVTDRPFGVNQWLHTELLPPADPARVPERTMTAVQGQLNVFRKRLGLATVDGRAPGMPDLIEEAFAVVLDERVPVWSIGLGNPTAEMVRRCHERGVKVMAMVATVDDARAVVANGVDIVVAQGGEAGGHRSTWVKRPREEASIATLTLVPQVVDAVRVPVLAAGGIADGAASSLPWRSAPRAPSSARASWPRANRWPPRSGRSACWRATARRRRCPKRSRGCGRVCSATGSPTSTLPRARRCCRR
jgi:nitronate monooxygenase